MLNTGCSIQNATPSHEFLPVRNDETYGSIGFLKRHPVVTPDALLEFGSFSCFVAM
jgi:hypothetical protein